MQFPWLTYPNQDTLLGAEEGAQAAFKHVATQRRVNKIREKEERSVWQATGIICRIKKPPIIFMAHFPCHWVKTRLEVTAKILPTARIPQFKDEDDTLVGT